MAEGRCATVQDKGIPRVAIRDEWTRFESVSGELFEKCADRLGYKVADVTASNKNSAMLAAIAKEAGVEPFNPKVVDKYRAAQLRRVCHFWLRLCAHVGLLLVGNGLWIYFMSIPKISDWFEFLFPMLPINAALVLLGGMAIWIPGGEWGWKSTRLKGYSKPVPEFALAYALAMNEVNPNVDFQVSELRHEDRTADPFLTAHFGDRMYYIAVWDEPKFEGRKAA